MKNVINWFEVPVKDMDRAIKFYCETLGLEKMDQTNMGGAQMAFFPHQEANVSGALVLANGFEPGDKGVFIYFDGGDDLNNVLSRVEGAGGKVVQKKTQIAPEIGHYGVFLDTEGNRLGVHSKK
jgi:predicted enzyme related to lactoylglutathione lyase